MINQVKVFNADGTLRKIISDKEMQKRFDKNNSIVASGLKKDFNLSNTRIVDKIQKECLGCGTPYMGNRRSKHCSLPCQTKHKNKLAEKNVKAKAVAVHFAGEANGKLIRICDRREPLTDYEKSRTRTNAVEVDCKRGLKSKAVQDALEKGMN